ncbi:MAG: penicillin-binding protein 2 [bacterium]|nr:penicillin-binding protein 2 [bacterium]MDE0352602.1 penicillin-binding protein 2 [bacterium]
MATRKPRRLVKQSTDVRLLSIALIFVGCWVFIGYQLYQVQVVDAAAYREAADRQLIRVEETAAVRGTIFDRQNRELAITSQSRSIYADPRQIEDPSGTASVLSKLLEVDIHTLRDKLYSDTTFQFIARQVDTDTAAKVEALELPGIHLLPEPKRVYPYGPLAAHVVGFVNIDSEGIEGVEAEYDDLLTGVPGRVLAERAARGQLIPQGRTEIEPAVAGADLVLAIDREIQFMAYRECVETLVVAQAKRCIAVAMDPGTFEVLAMAVAPAFDPTTRTQDDIDSGRLVNMAIRSVYEPGSTQKAVTVAAALNEGVVAWDTQYLVQDEFEVVENTCDGDGVQEFGCYRDFSPHEPMVMTVRDCVRLSSNVCMVKIGRDLGVDKLRSYLDAFGYGQLTGIDYPGEAGGAVNLPHGCPTCPASASIGYSLSVTALQMASVYSTIANGGVRMGPRLMIGWADGDGLQQTEPSAGTRVITEDTARTVRLLLKSVVDSGTGTNAAVPGYTVAGKTGTTRRFDSDLGGYTTDYISSFVGMAPVDDPRLVLVVVVDSPQVGSTVAERTGGAVAAPAFSRIMEASLHQMGVRPDA